MVRWGTRSLFVMPLLLAIGGFLRLETAAEERARTSSPVGPNNREAVSQFVSGFCVECHNNQDQGTGLDFEAIDCNNLSKNPIVWEKVVRKLAARQMPPEDAIRPSRRTYESILSELTDSLDHAAALHPEPGRTETFRRLNRREYQNAIRDLLAVDIDASSLLPNDESSRGFDNVTVGDLSPTLLDRYVTAAQKISRIAIGRPSRSPGGDLIRIRPDLTQEDHVEGLPIGTRGGAIFPYTFVQDGEYEIQLRLARDRNEHVEGLREPHVVEILLDRQPVASFTVTAPESERDHQTADAHLKARIRVTAGEHKVGVTFVRESRSLLETKRQPFQAHYNMHRHPRITPALFQVSITGPFDPHGPGDTASRRRLFVCQPTGAGDEEACAERILAALFAGLPPVGHRGGPQEPGARVPARRADGDFESAIEMALSAVLVNPNFLFRIEADPPAIPPKSAYRIPDFQLASRLSFFIWSSIPDDALLDLAEHGELSKPEVIEQQVLRMLADPRSRSLVSDFAAQWLQLRNLESITPDLRLFPDFDDNLRQAFRQETELLFESVVRDDLSVLELLESDHTFLNERLAKHYGVPNVYGSRFRRVSPGEQSMRGGLLRQGSILTVTSYANRTSPVIRGKWILENILGTPPPPQPLNVPALKDNTVSSALSVRERLADHRANAACAACHKLMDPVGFSLENFDAVGRWRVSEEDRPIDSTGGLPDGSRFEGVLGLERAILKRPELFVGTLTEKLLTFALGRGVEPLDAPAVRKIIRDARRGIIASRRLSSGLRQAHPFR